MTNQLTDAVCGMQVDATKNTLEHKGVNYAFCSPQCRKKFSDDPGKYVSGMASNQAKGSSCCS